MNHDNFDSYLNESTAPTPNVGNRRAMQSIPPKTMFPMRGSRPAYNRALFENVDNQLQISSTQPLQASFLPLLRAGIHSRRRSLASPDLEAFLSHALSDDAVVESYFQPASFTLPLSGQAHGSKGETPLAASLKAAELASRTCGLGREEKRVAYAASLLYSCGLYHSVLPFVVRNGDVSKVKIEEARYATSLLLESALRCLRSQNPELGALMTAAITGAAPDEELASPKKAAMLHSAVHLANLPITRAWLMLDDWLSLY